MINLIGKKSLDALEYLSVILYYACLYIPLNSRLSPHEDQVTYTRTSRQLVYS